MKKKPNTFAHALGKTYAYFQHSIDIATSWAFGKLTRISSSPKQETSSLPVRWLKKIGGFFGAAGSAFYEEYEGLKKDQEATKHKK